MENFTRAQSMPSWTLEADDICKHAKGVRDLESVLLVPLGLPRSMMLRGSVASVFVCNDWVSDQKAELLVLFVPERDKDATEDILADCYY